MSTGPGDTKSPHNPTTPGDLSIAGQVHPDVQSGSGASPKHQGVQTMRRHHVNKAKSAQQFRNNSKKTKAANLKVMRGGIRL